MRLNVTVGPAARAAELRRVAEPPQAAAQLRDHDDRDQFLAGVDLFLAGATADNQ